MPTYVYACDSCGAEFEQFQSFKDEPLRECPRCAQAIRRVFQPVGIVFKGSGWYINDSRGASSTASVADADKGKADKVEKSEAKAEAKTDKAEASEKSSEPATKPASSAAPASAA
jgi:putative FmdB family regulatory protein